MKLWPVAAACLLLLLGAQPALAYVTLVRSEPAPGSPHANLVRSEPAAGSAQKVPPTSVKIWFSENPEPRFTTISVVNSTGAPVSKGDSHALAGDATGMEVSLSDLPLGLYTVVWKAISAVDGHATSGSFAFTVGDVPLAESSPREVITLVDSALSAAALPGVDQVIARWFNLLALVLLGGSFAFPLLILYPAVRKPPQGVPAAQIETARSAWARRWARLLVVNLIVFALATLVALVAQAALTGGPATIPVVITSTRFGTLWLLRLAVLVALGVLLARALPAWSLGGPSGRTFYAAAALSVALMFIQSLNSHGAALDDPPFLALAVDFVHMLGTAIWIGSLFQLLFSLPVFTRSFDAARQARLLAQIIARVSLVLMLTVNAIILTGAYALVVQVGSLEAFFASLYGQSLLIKFILIGLLLALAAFNLIVVRPGLAEASAGPRPTSRGPLLRVQAGSLYAAQRAIGLVRGFRRATAAEVVLGCAVLLVVGALTSVAPARSAYDPNPKLVLQTQQVDDLVVTLGIAPGLIGPNDFDVQIHDLSGRPVSDAVVVRLLGTMRDMDMGTQEIVTAPQGDGNYTVHADLLSMVGHWDVEALIRRTGRDDSRTTFKLLALDKSSPPATPDYVLALQEPAIQLGLGMTLAGFLLGTGIVLLGRFKRTVRLAAETGAVGVAVLGLLLVVRTPVTATPGLVLPGTFLFVPESARFVRSPIAPSPDQIAAGRQNFQQTCIVCHGPQGKGNGPLAATLNPKPVDLTVHGALHTEGELYYWITNGIPGTAMPKWQATYTDLQRWQLVEYIRSISLPTLNATPTPAPTSAP